MLRKIEHFGYVLTDQTGWPRFWSTAWSLLAGAGLAPATLKKRLLHIDDFYAHVESTLPPTHLDDALNTLKFEQIEDLLESYFVSLRNVSKVSSSIGERWRTNLNFCRDISERLARSDATGARFADIAVRLERLERLYGQLRPPKPQTVTFVRALPAAVLEELYSNVVPGAEKNPFPNPTTQWRVYATFLLLLHQGLRRSETLILPVDFLKHERSAKGVQYWLNVKATSQEDDSRYSTPSIKTVSSIRQIPVSATTAQALMAYAENYRGNQNHSYFLSSAKNRPLSAEGVNYFLRLLSRSLSKTALKMLEDRTGMHSISPHDLRHTAAVIRMKQLLSKGDPMPEALQKMRSFFGWARDSTMPQLYAKAAFEERLATVWSDEFDERTAMLMELPE
ncbi:tyrosine-type recombinase/integrase [Massilia sp. CCM 8733]|uniref:Tyrosine-type recombinase/integrase n=1 Tax=Massilia mucilaginosa TaxID=2609282 RepID=A0ABX0NVX2_9BURK|nr:site-specific integrase [Massilia mucilaginosa]NHZ91058.1 tyrosine-type recombinase/integrase [Massilia mucilaginosa]